MSSKDYLTSKVGIDAHKLTNIVDLIKKMKSEEKKEKIHTLLLIVAGLFVLIIFGFIISF